MPSSVPAEPATGRPTPRWALIGLLVAFLAGGWLRLSGLDSLLPYIPEPDNVPAMQLAAIEDGIPPAQRTEHLRRYPYLLADLAWLIPRAGIPAGDDLSDHLRAASTVTLRVRFVSALFSTLLVLLTWRLARRFASPGAALLASALVATSLLHVLFAQQARPHGIHATFAVFAVLAALRLRERPGWANYALAGLACGLAFASLQSGLATLLPLGAAHLLRKRGGSPLSRWRILLPIAIVAALAFAFYPTQGLTRPGHDGMRFSIDAQGISNRNHRILFADLDGYGFVLVVRYLFDHDPGLLLVATLGLIALLPALVRRWRNPELAIVLAYVLPYLGALGLFHRTYDRFLVPLLPYLAVLGAAGTIGFAGRLARTWSAGARRGFATAVFLAAIAFPAFASWKYASVRDAPDTVELAAAWIREHVRPEEGNIVVAPVLTLPLFHEPSLLEPEVPPILYGAWVEYQRKLPPGLGRGPVFPLVNIPPKVAVAIPEKDPGRAQREVDAWDPAYAVIEISRRTRVMRSMGPIEDLLREGGERVFVAWSEPEDPPRDRPIAHQDMPRMLWRLLGVSRLGPRIEIWRVNRR